MQSYSNLSSSLEIESDSKSGSGRYSVGSFPSADATFQPSKTDLFVSLLKHIRATRALAVPFRRAVSEPARPGAPGSDSPARRVHEKKQSGAARPPRRPGMGAFLCLAELGGGEGGVQTE